MLKRFQVQNYKNFKDPLVLDFSEVGGYQFNSDCIANGLLGKVILYGRNATGKTNLARAIGDIAVHHTADDASFLNANSKNPAASFDYLFRFGEDEVQYQYQKYTPVRYRTERLCVNGRTVYEIDYDTMSFQVDNLEAVKAGSVITENYSDALRDYENNLSQPSFLRWLFANTVFPDDNVMTKLRLFIERMRLLVLSRGKTLPDEKFAQSLTGDRLRALEDFFHMMGVPCRLESHPLPDGQNMLYFKHERLIPFFANVSSGTQALYTLFHRIVLNFQSISFLFLDEYDAFFHYDLSERFLAWLKQYFPDTQVVLTTHNTNLMTNRLLRPDCLFILTQDGRLTPLSKATERELREGHNLEKLYLSGEFDEKRRCDPPAGGGGQNRS